MLCDEEETKNFVRWRKKKEGLKSVCCWRLELQDVSYISSYSRWLSLAVKSSQVALTTSRIRHQTHSL